MRIALVGLGGMGTTHYLNYLHIADAQVVAAVGKSEQDRARAAQWGLPLYDTLTELCAAQQVDLADICAPTFLHKPLALEAIRHGLHVITEKPIALCLTDAQEMYDAADRAGVQLYVAQVLQFTREVETLHQVMADRRYGKPLDACFERLSARPGWVQGSWMFQKEKSGLLPFDLHIHDLDMMVSIFGEPQSMDYTSCGGPEAPCPGAVPVPLHLCGRDHRQRRGGMVQRLPAFHGPVARVFRTRAAGVRRRADRLRRRWRCDCL